MHVLVQRCVDPSIFERRGKNDDTGCPAHEPKVLLQVVLLAYSRGIIASRTIEPACRAHMTVMALACGLVPDHSTIAAVVASMQEAMIALFRDILFVCGEQG